MSTHSYPPEDDDRLGAALVACLEALDRGNDLAVRLQQGAAYIHIGRVYQVLARRDRAQQAFRQAIAVFRRLVEDFPEDPRYPEEFGTALNILADDLYLAGRRREANAYFAQGVRVMREAI